MGWAQTLMKLKLAILWKHHLTSMSCYLLFVLRRHLLFSSNLTLVSPVQPPMQEKEGRKEDHYQLLASILRAWGACIMEKWLFFPVLGGEGMSQSQPPPALHQLVACLLPTQALGGSEQRVFTWKTGILFLPSVLWQQSRVVSFPGPGCFLVSFPNSHVQ